MNEAKLQEATTCRECGEVVTGTEANPAGTARFNQPCGHLAEPPAESPATPEPQWGLSLEQVQKLCDQAQQRAPSGVRTSLILAVRGYRSGRRIEIAPGLSGKAIAYQHPKGSEPTPDNVTATRVRLFVDDVRRWLRRQEARR